ncbi:hypothetical protein AKO1_014208 [Acrasis kona]|uniref:Uncharacterized protein n=1 Tax=Acrasis kona TaxID=1008807 RepID=A0AAW2Z0N0_9EUKA
MQRDLSPSSYLAEELGKPIGDYSFDFVLKSDEESIFDERLDAKDFSPLPHVHLEEKEDKDTTNKGGWTTVTRSATVCGAGENLHLYLGTRKDRDSNCEDIESTYFSSITYELRQRATGNFLGDTELLSQLQVVDPVSGEEILKNNKAILKGVTDSTLEKKMDDNPYFETTIRFKFTDVSYHHDRKPFALRVNLYRHQDTDNPILIKQSQPIMVFARKKQLTSTSTLSTEDADLKPKKRKRKEQHVEEPSSKVSKLSNFDMFKEKLEVMCQHMKKMSKENREEAYKEIISKMYSFDPVDSCYQQIPVITDTDFDIK